MGDSKPREWALKSDRLVADCRVFKVVEETFAHPDGRQGDFYVCKCPDWVQAAAVTEDGKIVLVEQFRIGSRSFSWEFPGGVVDPGESALDAAVRELREETGYEGATPVPLACVSPNPAIQDNKAHVVFIGECRKVCDVRWDANEEMRTREVTFEEADAMLEDGRMHHSIGVATLYFLKKHLGRKA